LDPERLVAAPSAADVAEQGEDEQDDEDDHDERHAGYRSRAGAPPKRLYCVSVIV
jgi:hypothetical protein